MSNESVHSVVGGWLGAYYFESRTRTPMQFEATFLRLATGEAARFGGSILEDAGGSGGAIVSHGVQQGNFIRFTKLPNPPAPGLFPTNFVGTLSEDGRIIKGHWKTTLSETRRGRAREIVGTWEVRRLWHGDDALPKPDESE